MVNVLKTIKIAKRGCNALVNFLQRNISKLSVQTHQVKYWCIIQHKNALQQKTIGIHLLCASDVGEVIKSPHKSHKSQLVHPDAIRQKIDRYPLP